MLAVLLLVPSVVSRNWDFDYRQKQAIFLFFIFSRLGVGHIKPLMFTRINFAGEKVTWAWT